jgi:hypothetical protein
MADRDIDGLNSMFADFRSGVMPVVHSPGFQQARATARRRRTGRTVALACVAVIVVGVPAVAGAALAGRNHPGPAGTGSPTPEATSSAPDSPSPGPIRTHSGPPPDVEAAVTASPLFCPSGGAGATRAGNVGLVVTDLCNATLEIPAWPAAATNPGAPTDCPSGQVKFTNGQRYVTNSEYVDLGTGVVAGPPGAATVDLERDGANDVVVSVSCGGQGWSTQVLAFTRDGHGGVRLLGTVLPADAVPQVTAIATTPRGYVRIQVADFPGEAGQPQPFAQTQWRTYDWADDQFEQVEGWTGFPVNPKVTDLAISATDLVFDAPSGGQRLGTMTVTVRNAGASSVPFSVGLDLPSYATLVAQAGCSQQAYSVTSLLTCTAAGVPAGGTKVFMLQFRAPANADQVKLDFQPGARVRVALGYGDPDPTNDLAVFGVLMK